MAVDDHAGLWLEDGRWLRWAVEHGILRAPPLAGMRHPPVPLPRLPLPLDDVDRLLRAAAKRVAEARADRSRRRVFDAEQTELLVRLAADSGGRRGELAALKVGDIDGRVLHICRDICGPSTVTTPKSHQYPSPTVGAVTAELWQAHVDCSPAPARDRARRFGLRHARNTELDRGVVPGRGPVRPWRIELRREGSDGATRFAMLAEEFGGE